MTFGFTIRSRDSGVRVLGFGVQGLGRVWG